MNILGSIFLSHLLLSHALIVAAIDKWYSLGNYIEEEGTNDLAGTSVACSQDGSIIAVSSPHYVPTDEEDVPLEGKRYGCVAVYELDRENDTWKDLGEKIVGERGESLGISMDMTEDGETIIVGLLTDNGEQKEAGSVKIFKLEGKGSERSWVQKGNTLYGHQSFDRFGTSVDIADGGAVAAVGCPGHDTDTKDDVGNVVVYKYVPSTDDWIAVQDPMMGKAANDQFGSSLSLSQVGALAVGAPFANDSKGYVQMYRYNVTNEKWIEEGGQISGMNTGEKCGTSVAVSYNAGAVIVGSPLYRTDFMKRTGAITVYLFDGQKNTWKKMGDMLTGRYPGDEFGSSVDISDDGYEIAVGSPYSNTLLDESGIKKEAGHITVYHYRYSQKQWEKRHLEIEGKTEYSNQGSSVALSGDGYQVMGGAPTEGYASVYTLAKTAPPTMAPTSPPAIKSHSGFAIFMLVMFIFASLVALGFLAFKGVMYYRRKRSMAAFEPTSANVEMRDIATPIDNDNVNEGGIL